MIHAHNATSLPVLSFIFIHPAFQRPDFERVGFLVQQVMDICLLLSFPLNFFCHVECTRVLCYEFIEFSSCL